MGPKIYPYVGPTSILERVAGQPPGCPITCADDALRWLQTLDGPRAPHAREIIVTYTIGTDQALRIASRHSEHVACAGGGPVLAAGELTLLRRSDRASIIEITNQSTGFCPQPSCWSAVDSALSAAGIEHPGYFSIAYEFRRCPSCASIHIVKDVDFTCACGAELPLLWNFG